MVLRVFYTLLLLKSFLVCCVQLVAGKGIPFCAPGLLSCGTAGCYSNLLTNCVELGGTQQCQPIGILQQINLLVSARVESKCHVGYINKCGEDYCSNDELCTLQGCVPMQPPAPSNSTADASAAVALQVLDTRSPREVCHNARDASAACSTDMSDLTKVPCNTVGVASVDGISCFQSTLFNCAAGNGDVVSTCRGIALVAGAVREALNMSSANATQLPGINATLPQDVTIASASNSNHSTNSSGLLLPLFEGLADMVNNVSNSLFNISIPSFTARNASGSGSSSSRSSGGSFSLQPPPGIGNAAESSRVGYLTGLLVSSLVVATFMAV